MDCFKQMKKNKTARHLLLLSTILLVVSCGPKTTPEDIAKNACKCIEEGLKPMQADIDKLVSADTTSLKEDALNEAKSKIETIESKLDECAKISTETEEAKESLADIKNKALFDEALTSCTKSKHESLEKAKANIKSIAEQFQAAKNDTIKDLKVDAKNKLIQNPPQKGGRPHTGPRVKGR